MYSMRKCVGFTQVLLCAAGSRLCTLYTVCSLTCLQIQLFCVVDQLLLLTVALLCFCAQVTLAQTPLH